MTHNIHYLSVSNSEKLINYIPNTKHRLIVLLMLDCGLRVSETITIKFNQFDFKKKLITVESLKKRDEKQKRTIPLSTRLYQALADYIYTVKNIAGNSFLFPSPVKKGKPISRFAVNHLLNRHNNALRIPNLHPHALRHTFATHHIGNGTPLENIKTMLGHKSYDTTLIYAHIPEEILKSNVAAVTEKHQKKLVSQAKKILGIIPKTPKIINLNFNKNEVSIGRINEIEKAQTLMNRDVNTLILGGIGAMSLS